MKTDALFASFRAGYQGSIEPGREHALSARLEQHARAAREEWPGVELEDSDFAFRLGVLIDAHEYPEDGLEALFGGDVFLAHACGQGEAIAIAWFEHRVLSRVAELLPRVDDDPAFVRRLLRRVRARFLSGEAAAPPKIREYSGRGPLIAWVRIAAMRMALEAKPKQEKTRILGTEEFDAFLARPVRSKGTGGARERKADGAFVEAVRQAFLALAPRQRALLRSHALGGIGVEALGATHRVHASTMSRWLAHARAELSLGARARLEYSLTLALTSAVARATAALPELERQIAELLSLELS